MDHFQLKHFSFIFIFKTYLGINLNIIMKVVQIWVTTAAPIQSSFNQIAWENLSLAHLDWKFIEYLKYRKICPINIRLR